MLATAGDSMMTLHASADGPPPAFRPQPVHASAPSRLLRCAALLRNLRREDVACRFGGEEFVLVLPEASLADAEKRAEELRAEIKRLRVSDKGRLLGPLTVSIGLAAYPEHGLAGDALLHAADAALYRAKREGRDRVVISGAEIPRSR